MPLDTRISVRLPKDLAEKLRNAAAARGMARSEVVREALRLFLEGRPSSDRPWDCIGDLAGAADGGPPDLAGREPVSPAEAPADALRAERDARSSSSPPAR